MDHRAALIFAASLLCGSVHAGYAQLAPPEGWSAGTGGASTYRYPSAANAASYTPSTVRTNAALSVGGRSVVVPASMRMAANAGRVAAAAIYLHPGLRTAAAVASWIGLAGLAYSVADGLWKRIDENAQLSDGYVYEYRGGRYPSAELAAQAYIAYVQPGNPEVSYSVGSCSASGTSASCKVNARSKDGSWVDTVNFSRTGGCPAGWYVTPAGCVQTPPMKTVTQEEFEQMVPDAGPMPQELPGIVWPAAWPVEFPEIQPMFIPTGNPVPNPSYDPKAAPSPENQPWLQPGVRLSPAPTPNSPWQVDLQPVNRPTESPTPNPEPVPEGTESGSNDKPKEDDRGLCDKYPDIIACQKLEAPEDDLKLPVKEVEFNFTPEGGYSGSAACPGPIVVTVAGETFSISWQPFCDQLALIRPMMLAMAWLMAAFILIGRR